MEKFRIGKHVKFIHIHGQFPDHFPNLLLFPGQYRFCICRGIAVSPTSLLKELNTLAVIRTGNQLVNSGIGE